MLWHVLEGNKDGLSIIVMFMKANIVLAHVSAKLVLKHRVHELLFLIKYSLIIGCDRWIQWIKDFFTCMRPCSGKSRPLPTGPLFILTKGNIMRLVMLDAFAKVIN